MNQQGSRLFPTIEDATVLDEVSGRKAALISLGLTETMTVREVLSRHPDTRAFFEGLLISGRFEGYDCLDEVAWRQGMESEELFAKLEAELARGPTPAIQDAGAMPEAESREGQYEWASAALVPVPV